jgi:hypothetical protein
LIATITAYTIPVIAASTPPVIAMILTYGLTSGLRAPHRQARTSLQLSVFVGG